MGEAIGGYLIATDLMEKLSKSQCGYIVRKNYNFNNAVNEVMPHINNQDSKEIKLWIQQLILQ